MSESRDDITCKELVELVTAYLEGALERSELELFEGHLEICDDCRAYVEQMRAVAELNGRVDPDALEPDLRNRLLETFRGWSSERGS